MYLTLRPVARMNFSWASAVVNLYVGIFLVFWIYSNVEQDSGKPSADVGAAAWSPTQTSQHTIKELKQKVNVTMWFLLCHSSSRGSLSALAQLRRESINGGIFLLHLNKRWHTAVAAAVGSVATDIPEHSRRQSASGLRIRIGIRIGIRIRVSAVETRQLRPSWSGGGWEGI